MIGKIKQYLILNLKKKNYFLLINIIDDEFAKHNILVIKMNFILLDFIINIILILLIQNSLKYFNNNIELFLHNKNNKV